MLEEPSHGLACCVQARIRRLKRATQGLGNLDHRKSFEGEQDEDLALVVVQSKQNAVELAANAVQLGIDLGTVPDVTFAIVDGAISLRPLVPYLRRAPVARYRAEADSIEPRPKGGATVVSRQLAADDEEDFLEKIVAVGPGNTQATKDSSDERRVLLEMQPKTGRRQRRRSEAGLF
jgi:hypothetical protein